MRVMEVINEKELGLLEALLNDIFESDAYGETLTEKEWKDILKLFHSKR